MTSLDVIYRAIRALDDLLRQEHAASALVDALAAAPEKENIVVTHNVCTVDEEWLAAIERGLVFIGRAIDEDRQFIRSEGDVQPIEKVRHISKESVQHLSRHSDLIPEDQKEEDIVPNKLYTVERLSDYAVYENRFLYVLLLRIRDFVGVRYDAVMRAYRMYRGEYTAKKTLVTGVRRLSYEVHVKDEEDDVVSAPADTACAKSLDRMEKIRQSVAFFLRTPLMAEVSRADKIKSKITKTNVLRMNKNFREALNLYEYLLAYEKDGYTVEERVEKLDPVPEAVARELAMPAVLTAFTVYERGLGLDGYFLQEYEKEEARRAEEEKEQRARKLKALKKRIEETGEGAEQYMLMLEQQNAALEKDRKLLAEAREKIGELEAEIERLHAEIDVLKSEIGELNAEIERLTEEMRRAEEEHLRKIEEMQREFEEQIASLNAAHAEELSRMQEEHRAETEALKAAHAEETEALKTAHAEELTRLKTAQEEELTRLKETHRAETEQLKAAQAEAAARMEQTYRAEYERMRTQYEARIETDKSQLEAREQDAVRTRRELSETQKRLSAITRECEVLTAEMTAVRKEHGLPAAADFTTEEGFNRLEHEFEVLGRLVREEWTDVKKILRKEFYGEIRASMRKKKPQKTKAYAELCKQVNAAKTDPIPAKPPQEQPVQPPVQPAEPSAEPPAEQPAEQPIQQPQEQTIEQPAEQSSAPAAEEDRQANKEERPISDGGEETVQ